MKNSQTALLSPLKILILPISNKEISGRASGQCDYSALWQAQKQAGGWLPEPAIRHVADLLDMPYMRALEVATFYTMFNLSPVGEHFVQLCGTTPCMLRGSDDLKEVCEKHIGPQNQVTEDGKLSWLEVECLGACVNAPMVQINDDFYEDLTAESFDQILTDLRQGKGCQQGLKIHVRLPSQ